MSWPNASSLVTVLAAFAVTAPAAAQSMCGERSRVVDQFRAEFKETPTAVGLVSEDSLLEVLTSEKGTWTIIITRPDGASCLVASGVAWESIGTKASHRLPDGGAPAGGQRQRLAAAEPTSPLD